MSLHNSPPNGGTIRAVPVSNVASEGDELYEIAKNLACPECGENVPIRFVKLLAPEDQIDESVESYKQGLVGALVCGALGAVAGPAGIAVGMAGGSFFGSQKGSEDAKKASLEVNCPCCGHTGRGK